MNRMALGTWADALTQGLRGRVRSWFPRYLTEFGRLASVTALDVWAFLLPAISFVEITIIGRLIVTEILMLAMLPWLWGARDRLPLPRWFVVLWAGWLLSQVLTDIVVRSLFTDYMRGWAALVFTLTDFAAILVLVSTPKRARLFGLGLAVGFAIGGLLSIVFVPHAYAAGDPWKWALALPIGLVLAVGRSGATGARSLWLSAGIFIVFGLVNLTFGFRSLGGISLITGDYLAWSALSSGPEKASVRSVLRAVAGLAFVAVAGFGTLGMYGALASHGLLGPSAQAEYLSQSGSSLDVPGGDDVPGSVAAPGSTAVPGVPGLPGGLNVLVGGRAEVVSSTQAIKDSPILGHGSWAKDSKLVNQTPALSPDASTIPTHSYLLQSWVWAGLLGGVFWLAIFGIAGWMVANLYAFKPGLAPLIVFSTVLLIWDIGFSPYGSSARILASYGIALCLVGLRLMRRDEADDSSVRLEGDSSRQPGKGAQPAADHSQLGSRA